jgi:hypothetical protein
MPDESAEKGSQDKQNQSDNKAPNLAPPPGFVSGRNLPPHLKKLVEKADAVAAKTKLDYDAVKTVVSRTFAKEEAKVQELRMTQSQEPYKPIPTIDKFAIASPCGSTWICKDDKEKVQFCEKCQLRVYDFSGMEMPEAEEMVYKMEGRRKFLLHKRADGKFLTSECPVGFKRKLAKTFAIASASLILFFALMAALSTPHPPAVLPQDHHVSASQHAPNPQSTTTIIRRGPTASSQAEAAAKRKPTSRIYNSAFPSMQ